MSVNATITLHDTTIGSDKLPRINYTCNSFNMHVLAFLLCIYMNDMSVVPCGQKKVTFPRNVADFLFGCPPKACRGMSPTAGEKSQRSLGYLRKKACLDFGCVSIPVMRGTSSIAFNILNKVFDLCLQMLSFEGRAHQINLNFFDSHFDVWWSTLISPLNH